MMGKNENSKENNEIIQINKKTKNIRKNILSMLNISKSGHSAGALGITDVYGVLFSKFLKFKKNNPTYKNRDFLILSNGHTCPVLYSSLIEFECIEKSEINNLRKYDSILQGHPHNLSSKFFENSSGSLGQGISFATGLASSLKRDNQDNKVFCFIGDGELEEGQVWESLLFANKEKLDNLILILDRNNIQIDGKTTKVLKLDNIHEKFSSFGFYTIEFNGNDINQIIASFENVLKIKDKPKILIADTIPGFPISFMNSHLWHGKYPNDNDLKKGLNEIDNFYNN